MKEKVKCVMEFIHKLAYDDVGGDRCLLQSLALLLAALVIASHTLHFLAHKLILLVGHLAQVLCSLVGKLPHKGLLVSTWQKLQQLVELPVVIYVVHVLPPSLSISTKLHEPQQAPSEPPMSSRQQEATAHC